MKKYREFYITRDEESTDPDKLTNMVRRDYIEDLNPLKVIDFEAYDKVLKRLEKAESAILDLIYADNGMNNIAKVELYAKVMNKIRGFDE